MSRFGRHSETESDIKHNERLEFLGDAVVEFLSSIHLFRMFPGLAEGGLATYRASIVQNQHLAQLAKVSLTKNDNLTRGPQSVVAVVSEWSFTDFIMVDIDKFLIV